MQELSQLAAFRADLPEPSPQVVARARAAMFAVADAPARNRNRYLVIGARPGKARFLTGLGLTAALVVTLVVLAPMTLRDAAGPANAATILARSATAAAHQTVSPDTYWYTAIRYDSGAESQTWVNSSGAGVVRTGGRTEPLARTAGRRPWDALSHLPTDPTRLSAQLRAEAAPGLDERVQTMQTAASLLAGAPASAQLRAALFTVCSRLPGVTNDGTTKDAVGRTGLRLRLAVGAAGGFDGFEMVVDPAAGQILETDLLERNQVIRRVEYLATGYVHTLGDRPPA
jgi:hypothetical protein